MASLLDAFSKDPDGVLKSVTLRITTNTVTGLTPLGPSGQPKFDLVQSGEYGDFLRDKNSYSVCAWTRYEHQGVETAPLSDPAMFAVTFPLTGCTIGVLKTGVWFHAAANAAPATIEQKLGVSLRAARLDRLNFIFGPEEYDTTTKLHCGTKPETIQVIGMKMLDTKWTFWAQWQTQGAKQDTPTRVIWKQIGRYPNTSS